MKLKPHQIRNALLVLALGIVLSLYGVMKNTRMHDATVVFDAVLIALAIAVSLVETEKTTVTALKILTIFILLLTVAAGMGYMFFLLLASPILYAVTYFVALLVEQLKKNA